jgi:regulator of replication initiation timing
MQTELDVLESKLRQLVELGQRLRAENHRLRQQLASVQSHDRLSQDKMDDARTRLERLLAHFPENEA